MPWKRIFSAIVAIILALGLIILGGWYFTLGMGVLVFLGLVEYFRLVHAKGILPAAKTTLFVSQLILISAAVTPSLTDAMFALAGALICFYLLLQPRLATIADISTSILGLFYGGYLPSYWIRLRVGYEPVPNSITLASNDFSLLGYWPDSWTEPRFLPAALTLTFLAFGCIWAADIGAYIMGKWFGRTSLSLVSPKKTVEGTIFGILGSIVVAEFGASYLDWPYWEITGFVLGLLIGLVSLLGDLTESLMKRDAGVKDSGELIPGHGGILDRTDSYVFTGPLVYYFVTVFLPWLHSLQRF